MAQLLLLLRTDMKKTAKKSVSIERIRMLNTDQLVQAVGGIVAPPLCPRDPPVIKG